ncbi:MAG: hypothetical protein ACLGIC_07340 [Acidimicrobiia bacterium]
MLVLVSFGLVLLATILLVVGLLTDDAIGLIYLSIACSATAAVVLALAFRRARPKGDAPSEPPAPILPEGEEPDAPLVAAAPEPATPPAEPTRVQPVVAAPEAEASEEVNPGSTPTADTEPAVATEAAETAPATDDDWVDDDDWADSGDFDVEFPIADYDELTVDEIMPLLPQLYSDELEIVAERERSTKDRRQILDKLAELARTGTDADAEVDDVEPEPEPQAAPEPQPEPTPARAVARPAPSVPSLADDDWDDDGAVFPIADYDELTADQIIPLLSQLEDDELEDVKAREAAGQGRKSVITEIDRQLGLVDAADDEAWRSDGSPAEPPPAAAAPAGRPAPQAESPDGSVLAISGYDGLTVAEIRPLLAGLSPSELRAVLDHEVARDNRKTIVSDIERRLDGTDEPAAAPAPAATATKTAKRPAKKAARRTKKAAKKKAAAPRFPIARYDELTVAEIRPRLADLSDRELQQVRERELSGAGRKTILNEIDRRLG